MNKLWLRLALSFLIVTLLVIAAVAVIVRGSVESSFGEYVNISNVARFGGDLVASLENYYAENAHWEGVESLLPERGSGQGAGRNDAGNDDTRGAQVFIADADGVIIAATQPEWVGTLAADIGPSRRINLTVGNTVVGILGEQTPGTVALNDAESRFLQEITNGLLLTGLVAGIVTFVLGIGLAYSLTRPLQHLTDSISHWQLRGTQSPIAVGGTDEVQRLGSAFNNLLVRLAKGEAQRQRMSADVAHELRTPVTVMRGHLEAMMDGVYPMDTAHLAVAYDQVLHLARLVEDLRLLTQAEAGRLPLNRQTLAIAPIVQDAVERFAPLTQDRGIVLTTDVPENIPPLHVDPHRLQQVFDNLLSNALRHTPDAGHVEIRITHNANMMSVAIFNEHAQTLDDEQIAHLFDRFWRGEDARARDTGGSGLGLAITREMLRLQGGDIRAEAVSGGLQFTFTLPVAGTSS